MSQLGKHLKKLRGEASLYEVHKATGISKGLIASYEQGEHIPNEDNLIKLAEFYEVPYEELAVILYNEKYTDPVKQVGLIKWVETLLPDQEQKLLQAFRALPDTQKQALLESLEE